MLKVSLGILLIPSTLLAQNNDKHTEPMGVQTILITIKVVLSQEMIALEKGMERDIVFYDCR